MNRDLPPPNRAIGWFRFMLWMMPTCVALTTAFGFGWLSTIIRVDSDLLVICWFVLNTLATVGVAIFEAKLRSRPGHLVSLKSDAGVVRFVLLQLLIIPALSFAIFFAACLIAVS
jgi:hypothetical protein